MPWWVGRLLRHTTLRTKNTIVLKKKLTVVLKQQYDSTYKLKLSYTVEEFLALLSRFGSMSTKSQTISTQNKRNTIDVESNRQTFMTIVSKNTVNQSNTVTATKPPKKIMICEYNIFCIVIVIIFIIVVTCLLTFISFFEFWPRLLSKKRTIISGYRQVVPAANRPICGQRTAPLEKMTGRTL